jgi:hypothetical protein
MRRRLPRLRIPIQFKFIPDFSVMVIIFFLSTLCFLRTWAGEVVDVRRNFLYGFSA